ncbi:MAG: LysM peptidoglycan-binding domain-containing protein [Limisphaerales bacterium]
MSCGAAVRRGFFLALLGAALLTGCDPSGRMGSRDETREPHYRRAVTLRDERQYTRAAESFDLALEANPRSAAAHLDYARLCHEQMARPDQAIFHYQRYLALRPDDPHTDIIRNRIEDCRRQLAGPVAVPVVNQQLVTRVQALQAENTNLLRELEKLRFLHAQATNDVHRLSLLLARMQPGATPDAAPEVPVAETPGTSGAARAGVTSAPPAEAARPAPPRPANPPPASPVLIHYVRSGDTISALAKRHRTTTAAILKANPGLNPNRLRAGQPVRIPR